MSDDMGTFRTDVDVEHPNQPGNRRTLRAVLVDTGAELSWFPATVLDALGITRLKQWHFRQADGSVLTRWAGVAIVHAAGTFCGDEVVFGEPGDLTLLGARSLEGLNLRVDPVRKQLIDAGPAPAAVAFLHASSCRIVSVSADRTIHLRSCAAPWSRAPARARA